MYTEKILGSQRSQVWDSQHSDKKNHLKDNITCLNVDCPDFGISASPKIFPCSKLKPDLMRFFFVLPKLKLIQSIGNLDKLENYTPVIYYSERCQELKKTRPTSVSDRGKYFLIANFFRNGSNKAESKEHCIYCICDRS